MTKFTTLQLLLVTISVCGAWDNTFDHELNVVCPTNQAVSGIRSEHNNHNEDRVFEILCRLSTDTTSRCHWSGWVNEYDEFFSFQCNNHGFIHGMRSIHDNHHEDRKWDYYCCEHDGFTVSECYQTHHTEWDAYFSIDVPDNHVMRGVTSTHDNGKEDRQYIFEICKLSERISK